MTENQRLRKLQNDLKFANQEEFAKVLGIKQGSLSDIYRAKKGIKVSESIKRILEKEYSINIEWLEMGEGDVFVQGSNMQNSKSVVSQTNVHGPNIQGNRVTVRNAGECEFSERQEYIGLLKEKDNQMNELIAVIKKLTNI